MDEAALREQEERIEQSVAAHLLREKERMEEELFQARAVQRFMLPPEIQTHDAYKIAYVYHPFDHVGGDFLDTVQRDDGKLVVMIADVSGHGVAAALTSAMIKASFLRHAAKATGPGDMLTRIDRDLRSTMRCGRFCTALAGFLDLPTRSLVLASAGHPMPLLMRDGAISTIELESNYPLFTGEDSPYIDLHFGQMQSKDRLLLFTDGLIEAMRSNGDMLSTEDLSKAVGTCPVDSDFAHCVFESLLFSDLVFKDDVTLAALEIA